MLFYSEHKEAIDKSLERLKQNDANLKAKYNRLCTEQKTFRPELSEEFILEIRRFLRRLIKFGQHNIELKKDFYWLSQSYRMWLHYLLDRGIMPNLPSTIPTLQSPLESHQQK